MKKVIGLLSVLGIVLALYQLYSLTHSRYGNHSAFSSFPLNQTRPVEINWGESTLQNGSDRERNDQIRDWLLMAVLSDAGLGPREIRASLVDTPPARFGYLEPVSTFEYGETRSRAIGNGKVVALVPANQNKDQRADSLAHIADEQQKNTGHQPKELLVFEYDLGADGESVSITRRSPVSGASLFTPANGYFTARINDRESLERFLKQVDDVTEAHVAGDTVSVSGRKLHAGYRGVDLEDVAALWQSEAKLQQAEEQIKALKNKVDAFNKKWEHLTYYTESEKLELEEQSRREKAELDAEEARLQAEFAHHRPVRGSGFSLDPTYDYATLTQHAKVLLPALKDVAADEKSKALKALTDHDEAPFLSLLYQMRQKNTNPTLLKELQAMEELDRFQAARYDGSLQGTKVGMTLFYTDLLAKLKAIDYWDDATIRDFTALTDIHVGQIYQKEGADLSHTRVWFGPQDRGFQLVNQAILFGRNATRIYAASSDPLQPGKEAAPNASSQAFLGWWDNHYEEVAQLEQEYQRLNEIMKWSLLVSWLSENHSNALSYLNQINVNHNLWFPDWAAGNHQLRYQDWDRFHFYEKGYKGSTTEAMPILHSREHLRQRYSVSGGVSLGNKDVVHEHPLLPPQANELSLRAGIRSANSNGIAMSGDVKHTYGQDSGRLTTSSTVEKPGVKYREISTEIAPQVIERSYDTRIGKLNIDAKVGDADLVGFYSEVSPDQPIHIAFQARDMDRGQQFAEELSSAVAKNYNPKQFIASHQQVEEFYSFGPDTGCTGCFLVKLSGTTNYMKMQPEQNPSADVPTGWQARAASLRDGTQGYNLAWVSRNDLVHQLGSNGFIKIPDPGGAGDGSLPPTFTRGPPPAASSGDWNFNGHTFRFFADRDNNRYVAAQDVKDFPQNWQDLLRIQRSWEPTNQFKTLIASGDQEKLLLDIVNDPSNGKKAVDEIESAARTGFERAFNHGNVVEAGSHLKVLSALDHGPGVKAWVAVTAVKSGDLEGAVRAIADVARQTSHNVDGALDVINQQLQSSKLSDTDRDNLMALTSMLDSGNGRAFSSDGRIFVEMRLAEQVKNSHVTSQDILDGGPLYVLDTPSAKGDPAMFAAMPDQIPREVIRLPRSDLAHARPLVIETEDGKRYRLAGDTVTWRQAGTGSGGSGPGPGSYPRYSPNAPPCTDASPDHDGRRNDCRQDVYLYEPPPQQTAQAQ